MVPKPGRDVLMVLADIVLMSNKNASRELLTSKIFKKHNFIDME
jgi:hypothetical protein